MKIRELFFIDQLIMKITYHNMIYVHQSILMRVSHLLSHISLPCKHLFSSLEIIIKIHIFIFVSHLRINLYITRE